VDSNGNRYTLEITESGERSARSGAQPGDTFKLTVEYNTVVGGNNLAMTFVYSGIVGSAETNGASVSLTLAINGETITITIVGTEMTVITGKIVNDSGEEIVNNPGTVTPQFTSLDEVAQYLLAHEGGTSTGNSISLPLAFDLGTMTEAGSGWQNLLAVIAEAGKYVDLDLSACTMNGTEFNPVQTLAIGKNRIISLTLPNIAISIVSSSSSIDPVFNNFNNLKTVSARNVTRIGATAFKFCTSLINANFPAVTYISDWAFSDCNNLTSLTLSAYNNMSSLPMDTFRNCNNLTNFTLIGTGPLSVIEGGKALVSNTTLLAYPSASGNITINNITTISSYAFIDNTGLISASFPVVTTIGDSAFSGCTSLESASFPSATNFGAWVFSNCTSLKSVSFRATAVARDWGIGSTMAGNFYNCPSLTNFNVTGTGPLSVIEGGKALVRNNELVAYPSASGSIVMNTITSIGLLAFAYCPTVVSASFPAATSIGDHAFAECTNLKSVNIPAVTSIGNNSFLIINDWGNPTTLTITLGATPPAVAASRWQNVQLNIIVEFPAAAAAAYGPAPTDTTTQNWGNAFRGMGWDGTNYLGTSASPWCPQLTYKLL